MKNLFNIIEKVASEIKEATLMFSTGKDSIVCMHLLYKYQIKFSAVYLYFIPDISFRNSIIEYYEDRFNIKIYQYPQTDISKVFANNSMTSINKKIKKLKQSDIEQFIRKKFDIPFLCYGYKKCDSLSRRGILNTFDGIDNRNKKFYPLADWNNKDVLNYLKQNKLPLPIDYSYGFRDVNIYEGESLQWIYNNFPNDYKKIQTVYPFIDADRIRNE